MKWIDKLATFYLKNSKKALTCEKCHFTFWQISIIKWSNYITKSDILQECISQGHKYMLGTIGWGLGQFSSNTSYITKRLSSLVLSYAAMLHMYMTYFERKRKVELVNSWTETSYPQHYQRWIFNKV